MAENIFLFLKTFFYLLFKFLLGLLVVPTAVLLQETWKWWENTTGAKKIILGAFYVPASGFLRTVGYWWSEL